MSDAMRTIIAAANERNSTVDGDYVQDGLLYCGKCHTPKQCRPEISGKVITVGCLCKCAEEERERHEAEAKAEEHRQYIESLRVQGIQDRAVSNYTFANAEPTAMLEKCRIYADRFSTALEGGNGLLFWGGIGNGKTFTAACIANALIDKGVPVLVTSFPHIINADMNARQDMIRQIRNFDLLVLDDLGVERQSAFALETVYTVIDERYKQRKPLIVTTNLQLAELQKPKDISCARIYDRLLEMCAPVRFDGQSVRAKKAADNMDAIKRIFADGD